MNVHSVLLSTANAATDDYSGTMTQGPAPDFCHPSLHPKDQHTPTGESTTWVARGGCYTVQTTSSLPSGSVSSPQPPRLLHLHPWLFRIRSHPFRPPHALLRSQIPLDTGCDPPGSQHTLEDIPVHLWGCLSRCDWKSARSEEWLGGLAAVCRERADGQVWSHQRDDVRRPRRCYVRHVSARSNPPSLVNLNPDFFKTDGASPS